MSTTKIADATLLVQAVVRAASSVSDRHVLWEEWTARLAAARQADPGRMPWTPADEVTSLDTDAMRQLIVSVIDSIGDDDERSRLFGVAAAKADAMRAQAQRSASRPSPARKMNGAAGSRLGPRQCQRPGCSETFTPLRPGARWCSPSCKTSAYRARKRLTDVSGRVSA